MGGIKFGENLSEHDFISIDSILLHDTPATNMFIYDDLLIDIYELRLSLCALIICKTLYR